MNLKFSVLISLLVQQHKFQVQSQQKYTIIIIFFFSSTNLCEFWLAQLFLSISSSPASFVSNYSLPPTSNHSSHRLPILLLAFPSVLLHTVSICIWSWHSFVGHSFYKPQPAQSFVFYVSYYIYVIDCFLKECPILVIF